MKRNQYPSKVGRRTGAGFALLGAVASLAGSTAPKPTVAPTPLKPAEASATQPDRVEKSSRVGEIMDSTINTLAGSILAAAEGNSHATREVQDDGAIDITLANAVGPRTCIVTLALGPNGKPQVVSYSSVEQRGGATHGINGLLVGSNTGSGAGGSAGQGEGNYRTGGGKGGGANTWDTSFGGSPDENAQIVAEIAQRDLPEVLACAAG